MTSLLLLLCLLCVSNGTHQENFIISEGNSRSGQYGGYLKFAFSQSHSIAKRQISEDTSKENKRLPSHDAFHRFHSQPVNPQFGRSHSAPQSRPPSLTSQRKIPQPPSSGSEFLASHKPSLNKKTFLERFYQQKVPESPLKSEVIYSGIGSFQKTTRTSFIEETSTKPSDRRPSRTQGVIPVLPSLKDPNNVRPPTDKVQCVRCSEQKKEFIKKIIGERIQTTLGRPQKTQDSSRPFEANRPSESTSKKVDTTSRQPSKHHPPPAQPQLSSGTLGTPPPPLSAFFLPSRIEQSGSPGENSRVPSHKAFHEFHNQPIRIIRPRQQVSDQPSRIPSQSVRSDNSKRPVETPRALFIEDSKSLSQGEKSRKHFENQPSFRNREKPQEYRDFSNRPINIPAPRLASSFRVQDSPLDRPPSTPSGPKIPRTHSGGSSSFSRKVPSPKPLDIFRNDKQSLPARSPLLPPSESSIPSVSDRHHSRAPSIAPAPGVPHQTPPGVQTSSGHRKLPSHEAFHQFHLQKIRPVSFSSGISKKEQGINQEPSSSGDSGTGRISESLVPLRQVHSQPPVRPYGTGPPFRSPQQLLQPPRSPISNPSTPTLSSKQPSSDSSSNNPPQRFPISFQQRPLSPFRLPTSTSSRPSFADSPREQNFSNSESISPQRPATLGESTPPSEIFNQREAQSQTFPRPSPFSVRPSTPLPSTLPPSQPSAIRFISDGLRYVPVPIESGQSTSSKGIHQSTPDNLPKPHQETISREAPMNVFVSLIPQKTTSAFHQVTTTPSSNEKISLSADSAPVRQQPREESKGLPSHEAFHEFHFQPVQFRRG